jgi:hypothetical protein
MRVPRTSLLAVALAALVCAAPALAHSWQPPAGAGTPLFTGPAGGGNGNQQDQFGAGGGGGNPQDQFGVGGGGNPAPTAGSPMPRSSPQGGTAAPRGGAAPSKPKGGSSPWLSRVRVPWVPAFLPSIAQDGYAARTGTVADAIRLPQSQGGWTRDGRPVMVFAYDATNAEHRRLLATLDADARVKTAAHLFNCFRVDVGAAEKKDADARLSVFTADGTLVGEIAGQRKLTAVWDLLESAWEKQGGSDLANRIAKVDGFLKTKAHAEHFIPQCEAGIVCPDCGHERLDMVERVAELRARAEACDRALDELRVVAKK